jgi:hypothetical protein
MRVPMSLILIYILLSVSLYTAPLHEMSYAQICWLDYGLKADGKTDDEPPILKVVEATLAMKRKPLEIKGAK